MNTEISSLLNEKENIFNRTIQNIKIKIKKELTQKNYKIFKLKNKNLKQSIKLLLSKKNTIKLNSRIILKIKEIESNYFNFDIKLEDLEAMKVIISQIEIKEKKILNLEKNNREITKENERLTDLTKNSEATIKNITRDNNKLLSDINNLEKILKEKENKISQQINNTQDLEKKIFELEGIKKIQYETIYSLKDDIKKQKNDILDIKLDFKNLVDEFNKILEMIE